MLWSRDSYTWLHIRMRSFQKSRCVGFKTPQVLPMSLAKFKSQCSQTWLSARGGFSSQGTFDNIWRQFWLSPQREGMLLASSGWKTEMLQSFLQHAGQLLGANNYLIKIQYNQMLRDNALEKADLRNAKVMYMLVVRKIISCGSLHFCLLSKIIKRKWLCLCPLCLFCVCHHGGLSLWMVYLLVLISWAGSLPVVL